MHFINVLISAAIIAALLFLLLSPLRQLTAEFEQITSGLQQ